jgi:hypothetical protein
MKREARGSWWRKTVSALIFEDRCRFCPPQAERCFSGAPLLAQQQTEPRIAFVVGNAGYGAGALPTALNDAGFVAEALRSIGFEVDEGADLSQTELVRTYRDFLAKIEASGPGTLAFVYFSGHALSFEGENFLLGVDARLARDGSLSRACARSPTRRRGPR